MNPAEPKPDADKERRANTRHAILGELRAEVTIRQTMNVVEISPAGLRVVTSFPLQLDSLHDIRLTLGSDTLIVKGRITYCHIFDVDQDLVRYQSGVEYTDTPEPARLAISRFVERLAAGRRGLAPGPETTTSD